MQPNQAYFDLPARCNPLSNSLEKRVRHVTRFLCRVGWSGARRGRSWSQRHGACCRRPWCSTSRDDGTWRSPAGRPSGHGAASTGLSPSPARRLVHLRILIVLLLLQEWDRRQEWVAACLLGCRPERPAARRRACKALQVRPRLGRDSHQLSLPSMRIKNLSTRIKNLEESPFI